MHLHIRVAFGVLAQQRRHMVHGKRQRGRDAQRAARVQGGGVHRRLSVFEVCQDGTGTAEKLAARVGQVQPACVALDQARAQSFLQGRQMTAGRCVGQVQRFRGPAQAADFGHLHKQL